MSDFQMLHADDPQERARWIALWESWPGREVSAHPGYGELFTGPHDRCLCASLATIDGGILFPVVLRPLTAEVWASGCEGIYDLTTPYGYGGAFTWGSPPVDIFWRAWEAWIERTGIVCAFVRLSLFPDQLASFRGTVEESSLNVVCPLDLDPSAIWTGYEHKVRKNVNKARRAGLEVIVDLDGEHLEDFLQIYRSTMERRNAGAEYYFPPEFFRRLIRNLAGQFAFFHVLWDGRVVSTELVLSSVDHLYSFLGGTLTEAFDLRPNDLLKHAVIEWGRDLGKKAYILGGGYERGDGIFRYKLSFAPDGIVPFMVGKKIYDQTRYGELVERRRRWELDRGGSWTPDLKFFPVYRS